MLLLLINGFMNNLADRRHECACRRIRAAGVAPRVSTTIAAITIATTPIATIIVVVAVVPTVVPAATAASTASIATIVVPILRHTSG